MQHGTFDDKSDYAKNFICDFILGKQQNISQLTLF